VSDKKEFWQRAGLIILTIVITIAMIWINTYRRSGKYFREGESYLEQGKLLEAVTSYETAAHAYTPWNSNVRKSLDRLWEIGNRLQTEKDDPDYALIAFRSLRASIYAIRSIYMPYKEWIPKCNDKIRDLVLLQQERLQKKESAEPTPIL
jgi:hypothetical protein